MPWFGSERGKPPPGPGRGYRREPNGDGYLLVTAKGDVYPFGRGIATQQAGRARPQPAGYYVVCANGDIYNYGVFLPGSPDGAPLPAAIVGVGAR